MEFSLDNFFNSKSADSFMEGIEKTNELRFQQEFALKDVGISTRVMNHWDAKGLIPESSRNKGGPYTFNFIELIWLHIVKELREYGYPLERIKEVSFFLNTIIDYTEYFRTQSKEEKEEIKKRAESIPMNDEAEKIKLVEAIKKALDDPNEAVEFFQTNILSLLINEFLLYRSDIKILIDQKGNVLPFTNELIKRKDYNNVFNDVEFDNESYISISLLKFFKKFTMNKKYFSFLQDNNVLNENEAHILSLIREGKAKTITIKFKDHKPYMLETTKEKKIQAETRMTEILLNRGYQDISIRTENGNISYSNITTKKILK